MYLFNTLAELFVCTIPILYLFKWIGIHTVIQQKQNHYSYSVHSLYVCACSKPLKLKTIPVPEWSVGSLETVQQHYSNKLNFTSFFSTYKVTLQTQKTIFSLWDAPFEEVRKCPEQGSYLKSKDKRSNLAGGFNFNTANTTKPLSFQFYIPQSSTAGSSSIALPKVILGKRKNHNWTDWNRTVLSYSSSPMQTGISSVTAAAQSFIIAASITKKPCSSSWEIK